MSKPKLFGSSGIRGTANIDITPELALNVGKAAGKGHHCAVIARDPRTAGKMIEESFVSGLLSVGCDVTKIGIVPTPTLAYAARNYSFGVMITASHNTAEYIGMKLFNPDGMAFDINQQKEIVKTIESSAYSPVKWNEIGNINSYDNAVDDHIKAITRHTKQLRSIKVIVDCGNGAGSVITPLILRKMGCQVITLNSNLDGYFSGRNPEPIEKNLKLLMQVVRDQGADLGIAHDGDADRMMCVDNKGRFVGGDQLLAIFATYEEADNIVIPVDTSMIVNDTLPNICIVQSRVGDGYVAETMKKEESGFGGEPSGAWIFPRISFCPDGIYAAVRLIEIIGTCELSEMVDKLTVCNIRRTGIYCHNQKTEEVIADITRKLSSIGKINNIDGIRVDTENGWVLVRPSGTEPKIQITSELRNEVNGANELFIETCRIVKLSIDSQMEIK